MPKFPSPAPSNADDSAPPRPIGPERLRALREAILNGTYPLDLAVEGGLVSLFRASDAAVVGGSKPAGGPPRVS